MAAQRPIAVGTNDTSQSRAAVSWAARRARRDGVPLVILPVVDGRWLSEPYPWRSVDQESAERILAAAAARAQEIPGVEVTTEVPVGNRGRGGISRLVLGSTAHGILKHLPCPAIITRIRPLNQN